MVRKAKAEFEISAESTVGRAIRETQQQLASVGTAANSVARLAGPALAGIVSIETVRRVTMLADEYNGLAQRVRTATKETGDFDRVMAGLLASAAGTGAQLETTIDVFQSISRIRDDIGVTNEEAIQFGRTLQQLGVIGGASSEGMANGLRQLSQALAGGIVRAEEFNSLVENTPEIVARIGDGLGVTQGELRQLVLDGQLLADDVMRVILEQAEEVNAEFRDLAPTIDRASTTLSTAFGVWASDLDKTLGVTNKIAQVMNDVAFSLTPSIDPERERNELLDQRERSLKAIRKLEQEVSILDATDAELDREGGILAAIRKVEMGGDRVEAELSMQALNARIERIGVRLGELSAQADKAAEAPDAGDDQVEAISDKELRSQERAEAAAAKRIESTRAMFQTLGDAALAADDQDRQLEDLRFQRQIEKLTAQRDELAKHGQLTEQLRAQFAAAEIDAATVHDAKLVEIAAREQERIEARVEQDEQLLERSRSMLDEIVEGKLEFEEREIELEELRFNRVLENLERERQALEEAGLLTEELREGFREAEANAETEHQARIAGIVRDGIDQRTKEQADGFGKYRKIAQTMLQWDTMSWQNRTHTVLGTIQELTAGMAQENEIAFRLNQAAGIANATMFVAEGVTRALKLGPKGIPLAAVIGALGAAEIATIASTSFGGGAARGSGTLSGVPSEAAAPFNTGPSQALPELLERDQNAGARTLRIEFAANDSELARAMASNLRVLADEDDVLLFSRDSRQALELTS